MGDNTIDGGPGNDTLIGGPGDDTINGFGGNDLIEGGPGADVIDGGTGTDTISFSTSLSGVTVDLYLGIGSGPGDSAGDTYANVENIDGSAHDDHFTPGLGANIIDGKGGADHVTYIDDSAPLVASLTTGLVLSGGLRALGDRLIRIEYLSGTDAYGDDLTGSYEANRLFGHGGDDMLEGLAGADWLEGGAGNDTARYDSSNSAVTINLTTGTASGGHAQGDTLVQIENLIGSYANDSLTGNALANILDGGDGFDTLIGLGGDDTFLAGRGADQIDGGTGSDTVQISGSALDNAALPFNINLATGTDNYGNSYTSVENILGGLGHDTLTGNAAANLIDGGGGDDTLSDGAGADILRGGAGHDTIRLDPNRGDFSDPGDSFDGGAGSDTLVIGVQSGTHRFDMEAGTYLRAGHHHSVLNFEHVDAASLASLGSLDVSGTSAANWLRGGLGDDVIEGRGGADILEGGAGHDTLSYATSFGGVTVDLGTATASGGHATGDTLSGFEALLGSAFADTLHGDAQDNVLRGGAGDDTLAGHGGRDEIDGGDGDDMLWLSGGPSEATTGSRFVGGAGTDALVLTAAGPTARHFDLSAATLLGIERLLFFTDATSAGDLSLTLGMDQAQAMGLQEIGILAQTGSDTFTVSLVMGTATEADLSTLGGSFLGQMPLTGDAQSETVTGSAGDDLVRLAEGDDVFVIRSGTDDVDLGTGQDRFVLNAQSSPAAGSVYDGGAGTDTFEIGAATDADLTALTLVNLETLRFATLPTGPSSATLTGLQTHTAFSQVTGGAGRDRLIVQLDDSTPDWDFSTLTLTQWTAAQGDVIEFTGLDAVGPGQVVTGTAQNDLFHAAGGDSFLGGAGDDRVFHNRGAAFDDFDGGAGWDVADYSAELFDALTVNLATGTVARDTGPVASLIGVEQVHGSQADDHLTGDSHANELRGGQGHDVLTGGGGADSVFGEDGDDLLIDTGEATLRDHYDGGAGRDTLDATQLDWDAGVLFDLTTGLQTLGFGETPADSFTGIENLTVSGAAQLRGDSGNNDLTVVAGLGGGDFDNVLFGEAGDDVLRAGGGNDTLSGGFGNDVLFGEAGDDILSGGAGNDVLDGGAGTDTVSYAEAGGRVAVFLARDPADVGGGQGVDTLISIENVIGTAFDDRLVGDAADNVLDGGNGDDVLIGQAGHDTLIGGNGNDTLTGSGGDDTLIGGNGDDLLDGLGGADTLSGGGGNDTIMGGLGVDLIDAGSGDDEVIGNFGRDTIMGGAGADNIRADGAADTVDGGLGNDRIVGGNGKDVLFGGAGNDTLFGGGGNAQGDGLRDVFVFKSAALGGGGFDILRDFEDTIDKLDFSESGYTSFAEVAADAVQDGAHVMITLEFGGLLRIDDFLLADLTAGDFLF